MIHRNDVIAFYEEHNLIPGRDEIVSYKTYLLLLFDALAKDESLYRFCNEGFVPTPRGQMRLDFNSWAELISCYTSFMIECTRKDRQNGLLM